MLFLWGAEKFTQTYVNYIRDLPGMPCHLVQVCGQHKIQRVRSGAVQMFSLHLFCCEPSSVLHAQVAFRNGWKT